MTKKSLFLLSLWCVYLIGPAYLACAETITLSTYYPAPYGVYKDFEVKERAAVGDIAQGPTGEASGQITTVGGLSLGELWVADSVIFQPHNSDPDPVATNAKTGELIYNASEDVFKYYNGDSWVSQGGGSSGASYVARGQTNCNDINGNNNGYKVAYTGVAAIAYLSLGPNNIGVSNANCIPRALFRTGAGIKPTWLAGGGSTLTNAEETPCAVCVK